MTTDVTLQVPAHIAARVAARNANGRTKSEVAAQIDASNPTPKISIRASRFRIVTNGEETMIGSEMLGVIVGGNPATSRAYYAEKYVSGDSGPPTCSSVNGKTPDANIAAPVSQQCAACPNQVRGSKILPSGAQGTLCSPYKLLAVVPLVQGVGLAPYQLSVPVTGLSALREYVNKLANYGLSPEEVITKFTFDDEASFPLLQFDQHGFVPETALGQIDAIVSSPEVKEVTWVNPPALPQVAAPAAVAQIAAPVAATIPAPVAPAAAPAALAQLFPAAAPAPAPVAAPAPVVASPEALFAAAAPAAQVQAAVEAVAAQPLPAPVLGASPPPRPRRARVTVDQPAEAPAAQVQATAEPAAPDQLEAKIAALFA
jgi:hypothetical protein